jgi:hypothetical protein
MTRDAQLRRLFATLLRFWCPREYRRLQWLAKLGGTHMKAEAILAFACFVRTSGRFQDVHKAQREAQCKFSDGKAITIT